MNKLKKNANLESLIFSQSFVADSLQKAQFFWGGKHNSSENERRYFLGDIRTEYENTFERENMHIIRWWH